MTKRLVFYFGLAGYTIAFLHYAHVVPAVLRHLFWYICLSCGSVTGFQPGVLQYALLVVAPLNAVAYALVGLIIGMTISYFRRRRRA